MFRRILPISILVVSATAQVSSCVQSCLTSAFALASTFPCDNGDGACLCKAPEFYDSIRDCARLKCSTSDQFMATKYVVDTCAEEGVSISVASLQTISSSSTSAIRVSSATSTSINIASSATQTPALASTPPSSTVDSSTAAAGGLPTARSSSSGGLSTGSKAGIGAGVGVLAILTAVFLFLLIHRRRKTAKQEVNEDFSFPQHAELDTTANLHEIHSPEPDLGELDLKGKENKYEGVGYDHRASPTSPTSVSELALSPTRSETHQHARLSELYGDRGHNDNFTQPEEQCLSEKEVVPILTPAHVPGLDTRVSLMSTEGQREIGHSKTHSTVSYTSNSSLQAGDSVSVTGSAAAPSNVEALREEMKRIRIERERLNRLQELDERETELFRRIQAERGHTNDNATSG